MVRPMMPLRQVAAVFRRAFLLVTGVRAEWGYGVSAGWATRGFHPKRRAAFS